MKKMNAHTERIFQAIKDICQAYKNEEISVNATHVSILGNLSALEISSEKQKEIDELYFYVDSEFDDVEYMTPEEKKYEITCDKLDKIMNILNDILMS